jgi:hypothetical protein
VSNHFIPLGYYVLNGAYHIREALTEIRCFLLGSLGLIGCKEFLSVGRNMQLGVFG